MSYFPVFISFENKKILIIGGGNIAYNKLKHLLEFTNDIKIISKEFSDEMKDLIANKTLEYEKRDYSIGDVKGFNLIIAAIDNIQIQESIYYESRKYNCLYNCSDIQKYCDFIFPSYIKKGDLTVAISTSGSSPAIAKQLKIYLNELIPDSIIEFLKQMREYRKTMPKGKQRMNFLDEKAKEFILRLKEKK